MSIIKEFKEFATKGNVVDLAVGVIIGSAFGKIVTSLVNDILMPPIGLLVGGLDFSSFAFTLKEAQVQNPAVVLKYGMFINTVIDFLIVAFCIFILIRAMNTLRRKEVAPAVAAPTRECPECLMAIPVGAKRCCHCTAAVQRQ